MPSHKPNTRAAAAKAERIVIKIGSSVLASLKLGIDRERIKSIADQVAKLRAAGKQAIIVSSGAVAAGAAKLKMESRPTELALIQAAAAVGQGKLMRYYSEAFAKHDLAVGQMLLTRDIMDDRLRYLNARNTLNSLLALGVVPIINENDTVMVEELQFGDNDQLSTMVAAMAGADLLLLLTDVDGLHERSPALGDSPLVPEVKEITPEIEALAGISSSGVSRGGMASKLNSAKAANGQGTAVVLAKGTEADIIIRACAGEKVGTFFAARDTSVSARKRWLAFVSPAGRLLVDEGAHKAVVKQGKSLLPVGVKAVEGNFGRGDIVEVATLDGKPFARGMCNFSAAQLRLALGHQSADLTAIVGASADSEAVHHDNLIAL